MDELFGCVAEVPQSQEQYFTWHIICVVIITIQMYCLGCCLLSSKCLDVTVDDVVVSAVLLVLLHSASCLCVLLVLLMLCVGLLLLQFVFMCFEVLLTVVVVLHSKKVRWCQVCGFINY